MIRKLIGLKNRLAYRMTALILVAMLGPLVLLSVLTYNTLSQHVFHSTERNLKQAREEASFLIMNRLETTAQELALFAEESRSEAPAAETKSYEIKRIQRLFTSIYFEKPMQDPLPIVADKEPARFPTQEQRMLLQLNKPVMQVESGDGGARDIYFYQALDPQNIDLGWLVAKANLDTLWGTESLNRNYSFCIVDSKKYPLLCPKDFAKKVLPFISQVLTDNSGSVYSEAFDHDFLVSYTNIPVSTLFYSSDWTMILVKPTHQIWAPISRFFTFLPLILLTSVLLVILISFSQIRRMLKPLQQLRQGTRNLVNQQYDKVVSVESGDEFEEFAASFNDMTQRIGKQFNTLETMAYIDRLILSTLDFDSIVETVLTRMMKIVPCDSVSLMVRNDKNLNHWQLFFRANKVSPRITSVRVETRPNDIKILCANPEALILENNGTAPTYLNPIKQGHIGFTLLPIFLQEKLTAAIILGFHHSMNPSSDDLLHARDLAHRVAVALSNAAWEDKLYYKAHYDPLTELPNRVLFQERLQHSITRIEREGGKVALMFLDLDRFKFINDSLGHDAGDDFLIETSKRLAGAVRKVDTVSRLGGDEFTVILPDLHESEDARNDVAAIAEKILREVARPYYLNGQEVNSSASIGIAIYPEDGDNYTDLLKNSDSAMYFAKVKGKNNYQFYSKDLNVEAKTILVMEGQLHHAIENGEFCLHYQPRIHLGTGNVVGAEALIRWNHPERGLINPQDFIPLAEENGLITRIGEWAMHAACKQMRSWHDEGYHALKVSVNLSAYQFHTQNIPDLVSTALKSSGIPASSLEIEITESALMDNIESAILILESLKKMDVLISIDDFGTGYSSLSYLKRFPIHTLKIDQSFVRNISHDSANHAIVLAIINLAHSLELMVIAEGVENERELTMLKNLSCDEVQGFYYSPALPGDEFMAYLNAHPVISKQIDAA